MAALFIMVTLLGAVSVAFVAAVYVTFWLITCSYFVLVMPAFLQVRALLNTETTGPPLRGLGSCGPTSQAVSIPRSSPHLSRLSTDGHAARRHRS